MVARFSKSRAFSNRRFSVLLTPNAVHVTTSCLHNRFTSSGGPGVQNTRIIREPSRDGKIGNSRCHRVSRSIYDHIMLAIVNFHLFKKRKMSREGDKRWEGFCFREMRALRESVIVPGARTSLVVGT